MDETPLAADDVRLLEGVNTMPRREPCPACGRPISVGDNAVTSLGDIRRGVVGVTLHAACVVAVGREGVLELMVAAYRLRVGDT